VIAHVSAQNAPSSAHLHFLVHFHVVFEVRLVRIQFVDEQRKSFQHFVSVVEPALEPEKNKISTNRIVDAAKTRCGG